MKKLLLAAAIAGLVLPFPSAALAYPAGQDPTMAFATVGRIVPGADVAVQVSRVKKGCAVSVAWVETDSVSPVLRTIKQTGKSGVISIATPTTAGTYTLYTSISKACAGSRSFTLSKTVIVGKQASIVGKVSSPSAFVKNNPTLTVSGTIKSGSIGVANRTVIIRLMRAGVVVKTLTDTTNSSGAYSVPFSGVAGSAGAYTAQVELPSGGIYGQTLKTTAALNLR